MTKRETKNRDEIIHGVYYTEVAADETITDDQGRKWDVLAVEMASLDEGGWQIRETYISKAGDDCYSLLAHGDGYNGYTIGAYYDDESIQLAEWMDCTDEELEEIVEQVDDDVAQLHCGSWDMLEELQAEAEADAED